MGIEISIQKKLGAFQLDVAFSQDRGVLALLGGSGCGKSMTLRCIAGIEKPDKGRIVLDGVTVFDSERHIDLPPQQRQVGLLFQSYALFPSMTVQENILCGIRKKLSKAQRQALVETYIEKFHLEGLEQHIPSQLSGGQKQRCALARMLIGAPKVIMLDEPFSALDSYLRWELEQELASTLREYAGTVLFVSHDRDEVYRLSDRIAVYQNGHIDAIDEKEALFTRPQTCTAAVLTGCKNVSPAQYGPDFVTVPSWGLRLPVNSGKRPKGACYLGLRSQCLRPGTVPSPRCFPYEIQQEIYGIQSDILMIRLDGAAEPLHWELSREARSAIEGAPRLVEIPEDAVLYLRA